MCVYVFHMVAWAHRAHGPTKVFKTNENQRPTVKLHEHQRNPREPTKIRETPCGCPLIYSVSRTHAVYIPMAGAKRDKATRPHAGAAASAKINGIQGTSVKILENHKHPRESIEQLLF